MIKGLFISEVGEVQQIGELTSLKAIINTLEMLTPQLKAEQQRMLMEEMSEEELMTLLTQKKVNKEKATEKSETAAKTA